MSTAIGALSRSGISPWPAAPLGLPPRASQASRAALTETLSQVTTATMALSGLSQASRSLDTALASAVGKLQQTASALAAGVDLSDALGQVLLQQAEQTRDRGQVARRQVERRLDQARHQTMQQLKQIQRRIDQEGKSSFWDMIGKVFQAIGTACGAVVGLATGNPLLIAGSALAVGSLVTSLGGGQACPWVSLGLGLGGAAFCVGGAFAGSGWIAGLARSSLEAGAAGAGAITGGASAGAGIAAGVLRGRAQRAEASALAAGAAAERLRGDAADERELLRTLVAVEQRGVELVIGGLRADDRAALAALLGG